MIFFVAKLMNQLENSIDNCKKYGFIVSIVYRLLSRKFIIFKINHGENCKEWINLWNTDEFFSCKIDEFFRKQW